MKVLHVINHLRIGGAERLIVDSIPIYQKKGIHTDVLILQDQQTEFRRHLTDKSKGKVIGLTSGSVYNPLLIFKLRRYLQQYDIVHAHLFPTFYWIVIANVFNKVKTPIVYTEHSTSNRRRGNFLFELMDKFIYLNLSFIGCISEGVQNELKEHLKWNQKHSLKIGVIPNGINLKNFGPNPNSTDEPSFFDKNDKILIQVSRFEKDKDQKTLIRSLAFLPKNIKVLLVGSGTLLKEHINFVDNKKLNDRVKFLGNRNDIPNLLNHADIVVLSSNFEGFGLVAVEGMAAGKPVIASHISGLSEVVGDYGLLFQKGNEKDLAIKIKSLLNSSELYEEVAQKCKIRSKDFSIESMIDKYIEVYKNI